MAILIDSSAGFHRTLWMNLGAIKENPSFLSHLILTQVLSQVSQFGGSKENPVILTLDSNSWRKEVLASYKANRVKDDTIPWDELFKIYNDVMDTLKQHSDFYVVKVPRAEADDIIAVLAGYFKQKGDVVWILSGDKDFIQLQDTPIVNLYDPLKKSFRPQMDVELWKKTHILIGDKSDNIMPVRKGVGEKTAVKIVKELDVLLQTNPELRERYEQNETLIDFSKIPTDIKEAIIEEFETQEHCFNAMKLLGVFTKYKLAKHAEDVNRFKLPTTAVKTKLNQHFINIKNDLQVAEINLEDFFS